MRNLIEAFVDRSRATILVMILLLVTGYSAYKVIPKESTPDVKIPIIYVLMTYEGISPEDAQRLLLRPMENALRSIEGIKEMTSYAYEGSASIILEFHAGFESNKALTDVRNKVNDNEHFLPDGTDKPTINEINLSLFPVLNVVLTGDVPERTLLVIARDLKNKIQAVDGVLEVKIAGEKKDSLEVIVEPKVLEGYGLSLQLVKQIIDSNNKLVAAGFLRSNTGEFSIKVPSLIQDLESMLDFPVKVSEGKTLRVRDVAQVRKTYKEANDIARVNGKPAIVLDVSKRTGENLILTVERIKKVVEMEKLYWPEKIELIYGQDQSKNIIDMVADLENNIIFGVILVVIVVILSVGVRSAFLISLSIPFSFLAGILLLNLWGLTLNIVVLFSLILTVGMIVDDAIVVSEYADRLMINGVPPNRAFIESAQRMLWPVVTSTLVKIVVFMPLLFWPGVVGQFMKYLPITVIIILSNSLIFALFFQPTIGPLIGKSNDNSEDIIASFNAAEHGDLKDVKGFTKVYLDALNYVLERPKKFVITILGTLVGVYVFFALFGTGVEFFPKIEPESARLVIQTPGNLSLDERDKLISEVEKRIFEFQNEVRFFYAKAGKFTNDTSTPENTIGTVFMEFYDWDERRKAKYILADMLKSLSEVKGVRVEAAENRSGPPPEKPIQINVSSRHPELIDKTADQLIAVMKKVEAFENVEDSRPVASMEWQIITNRERAAEYGIDIGTIGNTIRLITNGMKVSTYRPEDSEDEVDILLKVPDEYRTIETLDNINVVTASGAAVPMSNFVEKRAQPQVNKIKRVDRERVITIKSDVKLGYLVDTELKKIKTWIASSNISPEVKINFKGEDADQKEASDFLTSSFGLALIAMFMVMLIQFNNIYHTIIIMSAVFLSTVGVLIGHIVSWQPFGIVMSGVGVIALSGIVLNNNILFVDTYQLLRKEGRSVKESIRRAGIQRLRPILLTAVTAILGLMPLVLKLTINFMERKVTYDAPSSQWWTQLSAAISGGLAFATVLTLFFTPCLLLIGKRFDRYKHESDANEDL